MGSWLKVFTDGSTELGTDELVDSHKASWSKGRLSNLQFVQITHGVNCGVLKIPNTNYFQFDRFEVNLSGVGAQKPTKIYRVIQAEILPNLLNKYIVCLNEQNNCLVKISNNIENASQTQITKDYIHKWISIILNIKENKIVVNISDKGKISNEHIRIFK